MLAEAEPEPVRNAPEDWVAGCLQRFDRANEIGTSACFSYRRMLSTLKTWTKWRDRRAAEKIGFVEQPVIMISGGGAARTIA